MKVKEDLHLRLQMTSLTNTVLSFKFGSYMCRIFYFGRYLHRTLAIQHALFLFLIFGCLVFLKQELQHLLLLVKVL